MRTCDSACVRVDAARPDPRVGGSRELAVWLAPAVGVALAQIAAQLVDFQLYDLHLRALNANSDASVVAWLTPAGMALALAGVLACLRRRDRARARRTVVAALLVGLLVVASARRGAFGGSLSLHRSTLMLAPALALLLALLLREAREVEATPRRPAPDRLRAARRLIRPPPHGRRDSPTPSAASTRGRIRSERR